jgi:4-oxalomesaconate hydratase
MSRDTGAVRASMLVISAHAADFVWRAAGAMALYTQRGSSVTVVCLTYGERGESARLWRDGLTLDEIKRVRQEEITKAAAILGADAYCLDAGDYPLEETPELLGQLVRVYREVRPTVVLTHSSADPYNMDHPAAHHLATKARVLAQAPGYEPGNDVIGAPPVFMFEPHQPEQCGFVPEVLLDITDVWPKKRGAMEVLAAQQHLRDYYTDLAKRRGTQAARNSGPNLGLPNDTMAEAYQRLFPQVTNELS